jgi:hypothetical protein
VEVLLPVLVPLPPELVVRPLIVDDPLPPEVLP